jgi:hypothetical protein
MSKEFIEMFQSLEEGILVIKNKTIDFSNDIFKEILTRISFDKEIKDIGEMLHQPIFKIFRETKNEEEDKKSYTANLKEKFFSLNDLMGKKAEFF